jgi:hypothetical protein
MKRWYRGRYHINTHLKLALMKLPARLQPAIFDLVDSEIREVAARKHTHAAEDITTPRSLICLSKAE